VLTGGLTLHGLRHGHQTRADHIENVLRAQGTLSGSRTSMSADETGSAVLSTSTDTLPDQHG
jgi:hypothetical protein